MEFTTILTTIKEIVQEKGLSEPFIVGGVPRDKVLQRINDFGDIDFTTGDGDIHFLAKEIALRLPGAVYQLMADGHARVFVGGYKLDFSSNFKIPGIRYLLKKLNVADVDEMKCEIYSRDFTCNTLLLSMDLQTIIDPTAHGVNDINDKIIKTCLTPSLTLGYDNRRIIRIIYLASKLNFTVSEDIIEWVQKNSKLVLNCRAPSLAKKWNKALKYNREKSIKLAEEMGVLPYLPRPKGL